MSSDFWRQNGPLFLDSEMGVHYSENVGEDRATLRNSISLPSHEKERRNPFEASEGLLRISGGEMGHEILKTPEDCPG
jgi:hypothetical protein